MVKSKKVRVPPSPVEAARRRLNNALRWHEVHKRALAKWEKEADIAFVEFNKLMKK